jgi:predicted CxxxxCH...CXXCH cytochrome family protein
VSTRRSALLLLPLAATLAGCGEARAPRPGVTASGIHPAGWEDEESPDFHGAYVAGVAWVLDECRACHGEDDRGSSTAPACTQQGCHDLTPPSSCGFCHGSGNDPAPPPGLAGATGRDDPGVGAHDAHLAAGAFGPALACDDCHVVPAGAGGGDGHPAGDEPRAHVMFGGLALAGGAAAATPSYEAATGTCRNTYCHGETAAPRWTDTVGSVGCGDCHGLPPPMHGGTRCGECHDGVADETTILDPARHLDGVVELVDLDRCDTCHGTGPLGAPGPALDGSTDPEDPGVGFHAVHLSGGALGAAVACTDCHVVPAAAGDPGHLDDGPPAEVTFGGRALVDGATPAYDGLRCSGTYCHGATLGGGSNTAPRWVSAAPNEVGCGTCHAFPPTGHLPVPDGNCALCHSAVIDALGRIIDPTRHVNGVVDFNL